MGRTRAELLSIPLSSIYNIRNGWREQQEIDRQIDWYPQRELLTLMLNVNRDSKKQPKGYSSNDIIPLPLFDEMQEKQKATSDMQTIASMFKQGLLNPEKEQNKATYQKCKELGLI